MKLIEITNQDDQLVIDYQMLAAKIEEFRNDAAELCDALQAFGDKWVTPWAAPASKRVLTLVQAVIAVLKFWVLKAGDAIEQWAYAETEAVFETEAVQGLMESGWQAYRKVVERYARYRGVAQRYAARITNPAGRAWQLTRQAAIAGGGK